MDLESALKMNNLVNQTKKAIRRKPHKECPKCLDIMKEIIGWGKKGDLSMVQMWSVNEMKPHLIECHPEVVPPDKRRTN